MRGFLTLLPSVSVILLVAVVSWQYHDVTSFPVTSVRPPHPDALVLHASSNKESSSSVEETEEALSDVDTRVLESMLRESKLDLNTEADVKKLLDRGTQKKVVQPTSKGGAADDEESSDYASTVLKTLSDTVLWKKLSAKASDTLESVSIWIGNKVEQDVKTLAALGLFAWERAARDVGRALPQASSATQRTIWLLTNRTNLEEEDNDKSTSNATAKVRLLRPQDEVKSVSREILGILTGQQTTTSGRNLRTIAPAGARNNAERLRRAYRQSRKSAQDSRDLAQLPGKVVDGAFELRRELAAETSTPGYKTQPLRRAIRAGTTNLLGAVRDKARLAAAQRKEQRRLAASSAANTIADRVRVPASPGAGAGEEGTVTLDPSVVEDAVVEDAVPTPPVVADVETAAQVSMEESEPAVEAPSPFFVQDEVEQFVEAPPPQPPQVSSSVDLLQILRDERKRLLGQIANCVDNPSGSWLKDVPEGSDIAEEDLVGIITNLVLLRNDIEEREEYHNEQDADAVLQHLQAIQRRIDEIYFEAKYTLPESRAMILYKELYGPDPLVLSLVGVQGLDDLRELLNIPQQPVETYFPEYEEEQQQQQQPFVEYNEEPLDENDEISVVIPSSEVTVVDVEVETNGRQSVSKPPPSMSVTDYVTTEVEVVSTFAPSEVVVDDIDDAAAAVAAYNEFAATQVEVIVDDTEFEAADRAKKTVKVTDEEDEKEQQDKEVDPLVEGSLRVLDVIFFVLEKVLFGFVPQAATISMTAIQRVQAASSGGRGKTGWEAFGKLANTKGKY